MAEQVRLKKREIKEDKFATTMMLARHQITENWQFVVIGLVAVALLVAGIVWFNASQKESRLASAGMLANGLMQFRTGEITNAISSLNQVITDNDDPHSVEQAMFSLGTIHLLQRNYTESARFFEMHTKRFAQDKSRSAGAFAGWAVALENQGLFQEAADKFLKAIATDEKGPLVNEHRFGAMRVLLGAGNIDEARKQLEILERDFAETEVTRRALMLFAEKVKG